VEVRYSAGPGVAEKWRCRTGMVLTDREGLDSDPGGRAGKPRRASVPMQEKKEGARVGGGGKQRSVEVPCCGGAGDCGG